MTHVLFKVIQGSLIASNCMGFASGSWSVKYLHESAVQSFFFFLSAKEEIKRRMTHSFKQNIFRFPGKYLPSLPSTLDLVISVWLLTSSQVWRKDMAAQGLRVWGIAQRRFSSLFHQINYYHFVSFFLHCQYENNKTKKPANAQSTVQALHENSSNWWSQWVSIYIVEVLKKMFAFLLSLHSHETTVTLQFLHQ